ncbi:MAG: hypothetical protein GVX78_03605 [Bacteroidetes bacterium]|jgi:erythromycin esterase|nr:hypothetical protein [Bacteroidota bacterium]
MKPIQMLHIKKFLLFIFSVLAWVGYAGAAELDTLSPEIHPFCKEIGPAHTIIGLGESTHGTKEFSVIRSEIVKDLVLHHNFRIFILEAEYIPCSKINAYLKKGKGHPKKLLQDVLLWPWIHEDFLELIRWMRGYNRQNPLDQVSFFGMDSQLSKLYVTKDSILKHYPEKGKSLIKMVESDKKPKKKIKSLRKFSEKMITESGEIDLRLHYYISCRINRLAHSEYRDLNARDKNMAYFVELLDKKFGEKSIIWSHNGHISKKKPFLFGKTPAGYHLSRKFKNRYASVAFDFKSGRFNAVSYDSIDRNELKVFRLKPLENTLSMGIDHSNKEMVIVDCSTLKRKTYINAIGAIYVANPQEDFAFTTKIKKDKQFNYIISLPRSSPTELLDK